MGLSEDEQRILNQIEEGLSDADPEFVKQVDAASIYRIAFNNLKWPIVGLVACFIFMVGSLLFSFWLAFLGFIGACLFAIQIEKGVRLMGRTGIQDINSAVRSRSKLGD